MPTISGIVVATGTEAAGRCTFSDVVDELSRTVDASDSTVRAIAGDAFRSAVRTMNRKGVWPWEILDEDITLAANTDKYTISGPVKKPLAMHFLSASGGVRDQRIDYQPYELFVEEYDLNVTGQPLIYTIPNLFETGQVRFYPIPDATDYVRFTYARVTPAPKSETEVVEVPDWAIETYMAFAWVEFIKRLKGSQQPFPLSVALAEARLSFRELSASVNAPGDRTREVW